MGAPLALVAAALFALAAGLQQRGALDLPTVSLTEPSSFLQLAGKTVWLAGMMTLLLGYGLQAVALSQGRLAIIQPLLVTTVIFALPIGYALTHQHIGERELTGALLILVGLAVFAWLGDPAGGRETASTAEWVATIGIIACIAMLLLLVGSRGERGRRAAMYAAAAGMMFGLSASLTKPTAALAHDGVVGLLSHWEPYLLVLAGSIGFIVQQVSLGAGQLASSVATVSVVNPVVCIAIGILVLDERLRYPGWHVTVAFLGLAIALAGAVTISLGRRTASADGEPAL